MIKKIENNKENLIDLLMIGDEQLDMIEKYLYRGDVFALFKKEKLVGACVVVKVDKNTYELKNISIDWKFQRLGYGSELITYIEGYSKYSKNKIIVGTGNSPMTIQFYEKCGFEKYKTVRNFFIDNYNHPIFENGKQLIDMIYLRKQL